MTGHLSATSSRRTRAVESFRTAADAIGPVHAGMSVFAITRGQFSMIDAVQHVITACAPACVSLWTWTIADYEIQAFTSLLSADIASAELLIDSGARQKNHALIQAWIDRFGQASVRHVRNHAKIAMVEGRGLRVLLRGSMNLNFNPRFEQLDVTEGGPDFDLVREIQAEIPILPMSAPNADVVKACKLNDAFEASQLALFQGLKTWAK
ncbi:MAG: hypothetical protein NUW01_14845 [Gemmatimonadaceae bacterium]|nr:hypothetical protein [Gemmatimonadaceae bacterium]